MSGSGKLEITTNRIVRCVHIATVTSTQLLLELALPEENKSIASAAAVGKSRQKRFH
jgi:hypothetical protein